MGRTMCFFAALTLAAGTLVAADNSLFLGTWKLNVEKSTYNGVPKPKEETLTVTDQGGNQLLSFAGIGADGSPIKMEITSPKTGGPMQITGAPPSLSFDAITFKPISRTTQDMIYSKGGKQAGIRHVKIAGDHQTITARFTGTGADGKTVTQNDVWEKQ